MISEAKPPGPEAILDHIFYGRFCGIYESRHNLLQLAQAGAEGVAVSHFPINFKISPV
jgi:hypothetical protein